MAHKRTWRHATCTRRLNSAAPSVRRNRSRDESITWSTGQMLPVSPHSRRDDLWTNERDKSGYIASGKQAITAQALHPAPICLRVSDRSADDWCRRTAAVPLPCMRMESVAQSKSSERSSYE